jgi:aryl-alcohol dehydrogenase-like predicted oxidoreductase
MTLRTQLRTHTIGRHGLVASVQGLGTMGMTAMYGTPDETEAIRTVHRAVELGVTMFDTADMYGPFSGEELLGRALALSGRRAELTVATKAGGVTLDEAGRIAGGPNGRPDHLRACVEGSLRRLATDHIDLFYLHRVDPGVPVEESFGALAELVTEGKLLRYLGLSEASPASIRAAHAVAPLSAVPTEYSLFSRSVEVNGVLDTVRDLGVGFVAYAPLGRGFLTGTARSVRDLPPHDFRRTAPRFADANLEQNLALLGRIVATADSLGVSTGQLALAWVLAQDGVTALPGTKRRTWLEQNIAASALELTPATLTRSALLLVPEAGILPSGDVLPCAHDQVHGEHVVVDRLPGELREEHETVHVRCHVPRVGVPADPHADTGTGSTEGQVENGFLEPVRCVLVRVLVIIAFLPLTVEGQSGHGIQGAWFIDPGLHVLTVELIRRGALRGAYSRGYVEHHGRLRRVLDLGEEQQVPINGQFDVQDALRQGGTVDTQHQRLPPVGPVHPVRQCGQPARPCGGANVLPTSLGHFAVRHQVEARSCLGHQLPYDGGGYAVLGGRLKEERFVDRCHARDRAMGH